jgi:uncharacterized protein YoxC
MSDFSVIVISLAVIVLCWAVVRINQKIDEMTDNSESIKELDPGTREPVRSESFRP